MVNVSQSSKTVAVLQQPWAPGYHGASAASEGSGGSSTYHVRGRALLVAQEEGITGVSLVFIVPRVTPSLALQRKRHTASREPDGKQPDEAAVVWRRGTFTHPGGVLHTISLWLCSLWGPWRFQCCLSQEPAVNEAENPSVFLNPSWERAGWKAQDPQLVSARFIGGSAATMDLQFAGSKCPYCPSRASTSVCKPSKLREDPGVLQIGLRVLYGNTTQLLDLLHPQTPTLSPLLSQAAVTSHCPLPGS